MKPTIRGTDATIKHRGTTDEHLAEWIRAGLFESVHTLKLLSLPKLSRLPDELASVGGITELTIFETQIETIPAALAPLFGALDTLTVTSNERLRTIAAGLLVLGPDVFKVNISGNRVLAELPDDLAGGGRELSLCNNALVKLPEALGTKRITELNVYGNKLTTLPNGLGGIGGTCDATSNPLASLPPSVALLERLRVSEPCRAALRTSSSGVIDALGERLVWSA